MNPDLIPDFHGWRQHGALLLYTHLRDKSFPVQGDGFTFAAETALCFVQNVKDELMLRSVCHYF